MEIKTRFSYNKLKKAQQEAEAAKDKALALALEQLAELKKKVEAMSPTS